MKGTKLFFIGLLAVGVAITACGGGGGGGAPAPAAPGAPTVAGTVFDPVELNDLGGTFSAGIAISNNPMVIGVSDSLSGMRGVKWNLSDPEPVQAAELSPLAGDDVSAAYGLNDAGIVVGESGNAVFVAVYWPAGVTAATELNTTGLAAGNSAAYSINNLAEPEIVGEADDGLGNTVAVFWPSITAAPVILQDLSTNPGSSAYFISNESMIVGESRNSAGLFQAVVWTKDLAGAYGDPIALATPVGASSAAFGLSLAGNIVGEVEDGGIVQGAVWDTGGTLLTNLGDDTSAQAIGQAGTGADRIVGYVDALTTLDRAAIWNRANTADNQINDPFSQAYGINDHSDIVGVMNDMAFAVIAQ